MTREEAIKIFNTLLLFKKCDCTKEEVEECCRMAIKALRQPPHEGRWEYTGDNCFRCTQCGEIYTSNQFDAINNYCDNRFPKGCPNCGADMREAKE